MPPDAGPDTLDEARLGADRDARPGPQLAAQPRGDRDGPEQAEPDPDEPRRRPAERRERHDRADEDDDEHVRGRRADAHAREPRPAAAEAGEGERVGQRDERRAHGGPGEIGERDDGQDPDGVAGRDRGREQERDGQHPTPPVTIAETTPGGCREERGHGRCGRERPDERGREPVRDEDDRRERGENAVDGPADQHQDEGPQRHRLRRAGRCGPHGHHNARPGRSAGPPVSNPGASPAGLPCGAARRRCPAAPVRVPQRRSTAARLARPRRCRECRWRARPGTSPDDRRRPGPRFGPGFEETLTQLAVPIGPTAAHVVPPRVALVRTRAGRGVVVASFGAFAVLFALVRANRSAGLDTAISRSVQRLGSPGARLLRAVSWPGFPPQSRVIPAALVAALWAAGLRLEAGFQLAAWSGALVSEGLKALARRPRPAATDAIEIVAAPLRGSSFPSGHVLTYVGVYGFLAHVLGAHIPGHRLRALGVGGTGGAGRPRRAQPRPRGPPLADGRPRVVPRGAAVARAAHRGVPGHEGAPARRADGACPAAGAGTDAEDARDHAAARPGLRVPADPGQARPRARARGSSSTRRPGARPASPRTSRRPPRTSRPCSRRWAWTSSSMRRRPRRRRSPRCSTPWPPGAPRSWPPVATGRSGSSRGRCCRPPGPGSQRRRCRTSGCCRWAAR